MADRYRAPGGWTVQVIRLEATSGKRDGEWLRVSRYGSWVADVRTPGQLEQWFRLAELESDDGALSAADAARASRQVAWKLYRPR